MTTPPNVFGEVLDSDAWLSPFDPNGSPNPLDDFVASPYYPLSFATDTAVASPPHVEGFLLGSDSLSVPAGLVPGNSFYSNASSDDRMFSSSPPALLRDQATAQLLYCDYLDCKNKGGFKRVSDLRRHQNTHTKPFKCEVCGRRFGSKADVARHGREVHQTDENDETPPDFKCPFRDCKRSRRGFARRWNMEQHLRSCHPDSAPAPSSPQSMITTNTPTTLASASEPVTPEYSGPVPETPFQSPLVADSAMLCQVLEERRSRLGKEYEKVGNIILQLKSLS